MADFRQLAEWLRRLAPGMARAGGSRVPSGVGQRRLPFEVTASHGWAEAASGGMRPHPEVVGLLRRMNQEATGSATFPDQDLLAALAYELGNQYGPFLPPRR